MGRRLVTGMTNDTMADVVGVSDVSLVPDISKPRTRPMCETEPRSHAGRKRG